MTRPIRLLTIFVRAGETAYPDAERRLDQLFARQLPSVDRDVIVVDNCLPPGVESEAPGRVVIGGDNRVWEFSAVDAALDHLGPDVWRYDLVHVATSAFGQLYVAYLDRFALPALHAVRNARACLGHIDCYNAPVRVAGFRSQHWMRSCFFVLPTSELKLLGTAVSAGRRQTWFSGRPEDPFHRSAPMCETYRQYVKGWLLGEDIGQGVRWHRSLALDEHGLDMFEQKALTIINEHLLGIRLRAAGCRLVDVTWLSTVLAAGREPDVRTPWWEQLAGRDRDAIVVPRDLLPHVETGAPAR